MSDNVKNMPPVLSRIKGAELMSLSLTLNKNDKNNYQNVSDAKSLGSVPNPGQ